MIFTRCKLCFRFLIISLIYFFIDKLGNFDFVLKSSFFSFALIFYGLFLICFTFIKNKIFSFVNLLINCFFIVTFVMEILYYRNLMLQAPGEAGFAYIFIVPILAMLIFFVNWLLKDMKQFLEMNR